MRAALRQSDRRIGVQALGAGVVVCAYVAAQAALPALPQLPLVVAIGLGVVAVALLVFGGWTISRAGRIAGHINLVHMSDDLLRQLDQELQSEPEVWGEFSFTANFLLGPAFLPIPLDDIVWTYRKTTKKAVSGVETKNEMFLFLADGAQERFEADTSDIEPAFDCVVERRPHVRVGFDEGLMRRWKADPTKTAGELVAEQRAMLG